jgi:hypothetical protein
MFQDPKNEAEVGWYVDTSADHGDDECSYVTSPHYLQYALVDGATDCLMNSASLDAGTTHGFREQDTNHDMVIYYYRDGNLTGHYLTNFTSADIWGGSERHTYGDNLYAHFNGLQYLGNSGDWNPWDALVGEEVIATNDTPNDWQFCYFGTSDTEFAVKLSSGSC